MNLWQMKWISIGMAFAALQATAQTTVTTTTGGTAGTVPVFTAGANIENSPIVVSGSNVGVGATSPDATLVVSGMPFSSAPALHVKQNGQQVGVLIDVVNPTSIPGLQINDTSGQTWNSSLYINKSSPANLDGGFLISGINIQSKFAHYGTPGMGTGINVNVSSTNTNTAGVPTLWGGNIAATSNASGTTAIALQVQGLSTSGTAYGLYSSSGLNYFAGNVGIGTTSPAQSLEVNGAAQIDKGLYFPGSTTPQTTPWTGVLCGGDYAESVDVTGARTEYEPGDVMVVDPSSPGRFVKSSEPYSTLVAGIYSTKPGALGRRLTTPKSPDEVPMAMIGIVPTKVTAENGAVQPGDLLVTSSRPGYAMKGTDRERTSGAILGKALGSVDKGTGVIEVLVSLQ